MSRISKATAAAHAKDFDPGAVEYKFYTDDGTFVMSYADYLKNEALMAIINDRQGFRRVVRGREIVCMSRQGMLGKQGSKRREIVDAVEDTLRKNGVKYYAPSGPGALDFVNDTEVDVKALLAGNQKGKCNLFKTVIDGVDGRRTIGDLYREGKPFRVWAWDGEKPVVAWAEPVFKKPGLHQCYSISTMEGEFHSADEHRILQGDRWLFLGQLLSRLSPLESSSGFSRRVRASGVRHWRRTVRGFRFCCRLLSGSCGVRLRRGAGIGSSVPPSPVDVQQRTGPSSRTGDRGGRSERSHRGLSDVLRSSWGAFLRDGVRSRMDFGYPFADSVVRYSSLNSPFSGRSLSASDLPLSWTAVDLPEYRSTDGGDPLVSAPESQPGASCTERGPMQLSIRSGQRFAGVFSWLKRVRGILFRHTNCVLAYRPPRVHVDCIQTILAWNRLEGKREVYDFSVPGYENYITAGVVHHNTVSGIIDDILDLIPCDPRWPIFADHGVEHRPWRGPIKLCILSYKWPLHKQTIWPRLKEWLPYEQIEGFVKGKKKIRWETDQRIILACESEIIFRVYSQDQDVFEGPTWTRAHWDEQGIEGIFDAVDERISTQGWKPTHSFTLTPHVVEGRPDTGGGSWIEKMLTGENQKGKRVHQYVIHPDHVPDWIYPEEEKAKKYKKWIKEPSERGDIKTLREGRSRYFGEWHVGGGLVYDEWVREVHVIDPFEIPVDWTWYRAMDHGTRNPTTCLFAAMNPDGELFLVDEYYEIGLGIAENCKRIIEQSGNERRVVERFTDEVTGEWQNYYEEVMSHRWFHKTVLDPRSFASPDPQTNKDLSRVYRRAGLRVTAATAHHNKIRIPKVKEWLAIDYGKVHPITGKPGRPRTFVFSTLTKFIREIESRQWKKTAARRPNEVPMEVPEKAHDHLQNAFEYLIWIPPRYYPPPKAGRRGSAGSGSSNSSSGTKRRPKNATTGY